MNYWLAGILLFGFAILLKYFSGFEYAVLAMLAIIAREIIWNEK